MGFSRQSRDFLSRSWPLLCVAIAGAGLVSCSRDTVTAPSSTGSDLIAIQTGKSNYTWDEVTTYGINATVTNKTDRVFYASLGDGMGPPVQQVLYAAEGSDGFLEQWVPPSSWQSQKRAVFDEGTRVIEIHPGSTYTLVGYHAGSRTSGVFRLKIQYHDQAEAQPGMTAHQDVSNIFTVR
jgi:hypothetical protein